MEILYGTTTTARMLDMNPNRLKRWLDYGYYSPDAKAIIGDSEYRLFSERDVKMLEEILGRIDDGMSVGDAFEEVRN